MDYLKTTLASGCQVQFTAREYRALYIAAYYDPIFKSQTAQGGVLHMIGNHFPPDEDLCSPDQLSEPVTLAWDEVDTLAKVAESIHLINSECLGLPTVIPEELARQIQHNLHEAMKRMRFDAERAMEHIEKDPVVYIMIDRDGGFETFRGNQKQTAIQGVMDHEGEGSVELFELNLKTLKKKSICWCADGEFEMSKGEEDLQKDPMAGGRKLICGDEAQAEIVDITNPFWVGLLDEHNKEITAPEYRRQKAMFIWDGGKRQISVTFPTAVSDWGTVRYFALYQSETSPHEMWIGDLMQSCRALPQITLSVTWTWNAGGSARGVLSDC